MATDQLIKTCGRLRLWRSTQGFWWSLTSRVGETWCWDPASKLFTATCYFSRTVMAATVTTARMMIGAEPQE